MKEYTTEDIKQEFIKKYINNDFRIIGNSTQQSTTIEIQNAHFIVDKPWILREPNYDYFNRELEWYDKKSLNINDIPGKIPSQWKLCATPDGYINSNYGWIIYSDENYNQFESCVNKLIADPYTREACMIYSRPSIQQEYNKNGMHDFICTYSVQCFINNINNDNYLDYIVYMRSNDAIYGFCNDSLWHITVMNRLKERLSKELNENIKLGKLYWNAGSLHIYERHFNYLKENRES